MTFVNRGDFVASSYYACSILENFNVVPNKK
jgi:hypothetical protein